MTVLPSFTNSRVLVVGDIMLDRYWYGATSRISPEAPVPVVKVDDLVEKPGGAANVATNITSLGGQAILMGFVGADESADKLENLLHEAKVKTAFVRHPELPTITKLRVLSHHQQLIRLDFEQAHGQLSNQEIIHNFRQMLSNVDMVVLSDYGKGCLHDPEPFIQAAQAASVPILIDPKRLDFKVYKGASLVTPNRGEFEAVVGKCTNEQEIIDKGLNLLYECGFEALLITRGEQGMTLITKKTPPLHLPAYAREVYDVTGAGDTVIGVLAATLGTGADLPTAVKLANAAAGVVVGKLGTATVTPTELSLALTSLQPVKQGIVSVEELMTLRHAASARGERVVMTNGCFDLIHAGHVTYLEQAKELGDRLIIAVNDDESVARLKGPLRPINSLENRLRVLTSLRAVDWVVPFSADTPGELIAQVLPDILVKGDDYEIHEIAGNEAVLTNGGQVKTLALVPGCSTTAIIEKMKN